MRFLLQLGLVSLMAISSAVQATIVDLGTVTQDTDTGFEWLDLSFTSGVSTSSVELNLDVYEGGGWQFASNAQVDAFITNITGVSTLAVSTSALYEGHTDLVASFVGYSNAGSGQSLEFVEGWTVNALLAPGLVDGRYTLVDFDNGTDYRRAEFFTGQVRDLNFQPSWLVRNTTVVPAPSTALLFVFPGLALMFARRSTKTRYE